MTEPSIRHVVLMCHAPIVIPQIAGEQAPEIHQTTNAMKAVADQLVSKKPDVLIVLSPHAARDESAFRLIGGSKVKGSFSRFGFPQIRIELPTAIAARKQIHQAAKQLKVPVLADSSFSISNDQQEPLDHGAGVPLYFLQEAGWTGPTVEISFPFEPSHDECRRFGEALAQAAAQSGENWCLLASGDLSHRLIRGAPAGFHPLAQEFDSSFTKAVREGNYQAACEIDPKLRTIAAEDVIDSFEIAAAAVSFQSKNHRVLSYEGPFGVGYCIGILYSARE